MSVSELIRKFDVGTAVPVDVNDVVAALRDGGIRDEIYFWPSDINSEELRGQFVHYDPDKDWKYPTDETQAVLLSVADIYYAKDMSDDWQRLVCCKELLHILDQAGSCAATPEAVLELIKKIVLPTELHDPLNDGWAANSDRLGIYYAVAVLFPWSARELFIKDGTLTTADIARMVDLPFKYVQVVMSDVWPLLHAVMSGDMEKVAQITAEAKAQAS